MRAWSRGLVVVVVQGHPTLPMRTAAAPTLTQSWCAGTRVQPVRSAHVSQNITKMTERSCVGHAHTHTSIHIYYPLRWVIHMDTCMCNIYMCMFHVCLSLHTGNTYGYLYVYYSHVYVSMHAYLYVLNILCYKAHTSTCPCAHACSCLRTCTQKYASPCMHMGFRV